MTSVQCRFREQPRELTVFYDSKCELCIRCAAWLQNEPCYFPVELVPMHSPMVKERFPYIAAEIERGRFVVADDRGGLYFDTSARLMCLYATRRYRSAASTLSHAALLPFVDRLFDAIGNNRHAISRFLGMKSVAPSSCSTEGCK